MWAVKILSDTVGRRSAAEWNKTNFDKSKWAWCSAGILTYAVSAPLLFRFLLLCQIIYLISLSFLSLLLKTNWEADTKT